MMRCRSLLLSVSLATFLVCGVLSAFAGRPSVSLLADSPLSSIAWIGGVQAAQAAETDGSSGEDEGDGKGGRKLPLPRFVSLRTNEVNMRAGPGIRYPVDWVYLHRDLPVEVIAEFDVWRKIRDPDGAEGWVHQSMLSGRRMMVVKKDNVMLRRTADDTASAAAWLRAGVVGKLTQCPKDSAFCRVEVDGYPGWLRRDELWGVYRTETID